MSNVRMTDEELAAKFGRRPGGGMPVFEPGEFGYHCPNGHTADALAWSEFHQHIWCYTCKQDFHYAQDCHLIQPSWMDETRWKDFVASLPTKPEVKPGTVPGVW